MILSYVVSEPGGSGPGLKDSSLSFILKYCAIANCMAFQFSHSPSWRRVLLFCVLFLRNRVGVKSERSTKQKNCDTGSRGSPGSDGRLAPKLSGCTCVWLMANSESHGHYSRFQIDRPCQFISSPAGFRESPSASLPIVFCEIK